MFIKILLLAYKKLINYGFQRTKRVHPLFLRDLSYNKIVSVNSFEGEALTALYMDHNLIERVHGTAFSNLTQLRYLWVTNTGVHILVELSANSGQHIIAFVTIQNIFYFLIFHKQYLTRSLRNNKIKEMSDQAFTRALTHLSLGFNGLSTVPQLHNLAHTLQAL